MYYEINVSLNGKHFFATHERSLSSRHEAIKAYRVFKQKFPSVEGYRVSVVKIEIKGENVNLENTIVE